jgi:hypothetical protein
MEKEEGMRWKAPTSVGSRNWGKSILAGVWRNLGNQLKDLEGKMKKDRSVGSRLASKSEEGEERACLANVVEK